VTKPNPAYDGDALWALTRKLYDTQPLATAERELAAAVLIAVENALKMGEETDGEGTAPHFPAAALRHLRKSIARKFPASEHTHTHEECGHEVVPMDVEGVSECFHCGPHYGTTEFCPERCDVARATATAQPRTWRKGDAEPPRNLVLEDGQGDRVAHLGKGWAWVQVDGVDYTPTVELFGWAWSDFPWDGTVIGDVLTEVRA
jgi:hypothetical protein